MGKRPSNTLFYVLISLLVLFGLYILGGLILDARQKDSLETSHWLGMVDAS
jgi:hypothetical protein